ncbi:MAG TPA: hypothetical protein VHW45_19365 [Candidatus Sulfotelmatobacter sp.]|nr:hypothetical protein [Candidatus Sulfotelmatobacter sp.]
MRITSLLLLLLSFPLAAQSKRLWVLKASGDLVEYDPTTFSAKQTFKLPPGAAKSPASISMNRLGQVLFETTVTLPLSLEEAAAHKLWIWNGHAASTVDQGIVRKTEETGSNEAVTELAPAAFLSADGAHLFWFANEARRLQREDVDLSTSNSWQAWQTDLSGGGREDIASARLPDCRCTTGTCEESCPNGVVWVPNEGLDKFFLVNQVVAGQTNATYKESVRYQLEAGKWASIALPDPLQRVLDANDDGTVIVDAIPDTGCCGWSNQSNDQTLAHVEGKIRRIFDERAAYKNPDYDVSFYTPNAKVSPAWGYFATTIAATAKANQPIQLAEEGQANPVESNQIRKALAELPAVEVTSASEIPGRVAFLPHASLVGWLSEKELLIVENHLLVVYNIASRARKKSTIRVDDPARVFLR